MATNRTTPPGAGAPASASIIEITGIVFEPLRRNQPRTPRKRKATGRGNTALDGGRLDWRAEATFEDVAAAYKRGELVQRDRKRNTAIKRNAATAAATRKRAAKARSAAARKGWRTRRANG